MSDILIAGYDYYIKMVKNPMSYDKYCEMVSNNIYSNVYVKRSIKMAFDEFVTED